MPWFSCTSLVLAVSSFLGLVQGGKWVSIDSEYSYTKSYNIRHEPAYRSFLRAEVKACHGQELYLMANKDMDEFVYYQLDLSYKWISILKEYDYVTYKSQAILSCSEWRPLWFKWAGSTFSFGTGLDPTANQLLSADVGSTFSVNIFYVATDSDTNFGQWRFLQDEEPLFAMPNAAGNEVLTLSESTAQYSIVFTPDATDPEDDAVAVSSSSTEFQVYGTVIYLMINLDYEDTQEYIVILSGVDSTDITYTAYETFTIKITNEWDETPAATVASLAIPELMPVGTDIGTCFHISDKDKGDVLTYSVSGSHSEYLEVDANGRVKIKKLIQKDTTTFDFSGLSYTVTDQGGNTVTKSFQLSITDRNNHIPAFSQEFYTLTADDGQTTGVVVNLISSDGDADDQGTTKSIALQDGAVSGPFQIIGDDLTVISELDYESAPNFQHVLLLQVVDSPTLGSALTGKAVAVVKVSPVNEHTPAWSSTPAGAAVDENIAGTVVLTTVQATDADSGSDGTLVYFIHAVSPASGTNLFSIDSGSGELRIGGSLNHDTTAGGVASYSVTVGAKDSNGSPKSVTADVTITLNDVNDHPPTFDSAQYTINVDEGSTGDVFTPTITDHDGSTVTLAIVGTDYGGVFGINGLSLIVKSPLDYETRTAYTLVISATDGVFTTNVPLEVKVVNLFDEKPVITDHTTSFVAEGQTVGTSVSGGIHVTDPDVGDTITYSISGTHSSYLNVNQTSGELTVAQDVDFDSGLTYLDVTVTVTDSGGLTVSEDIVVDVLDINDNSPVFSKSTYEAEVTENAGAGVTLLQLTCSDTDTGNNAVFDYSIESGPAGLFTINNGYLVTDSTATDFESDCLHDVIVIATDTPDHGPKLTGSTVVKVKVLPENEASPVWTTPTSGSGNVDVNEDALTGHVLLTLAATDADDGEDGSIVYSISSITSGSGAAVTGLFTVDPVTGDLVVSGPLDVDAQTGGESTYTVDIVATDKAASPKSVTGQVVIAVKNINDLAPIFSDNVYSVNADEDVASGYSLLTLSPEDYDGDTLTFSIADGSTDLFQLTGQELQVKAALDFEKDQVHVLVIRASDGVHATDVTVYVAVGDVSDETPVIAVNSLAMSEEQAITSGVHGDIIVTDADISDTHTFVLTGTDAGFLQIDANTGVLTVKQNVDRESGKGELSLTVTVTDSGGLSASKDFTIDVKDINDLPPVFSPSTYTAQIAENSAAGVSLLEFTCSDGDSGNNALYDIAVASGGGGSFKINGNQLQTDGPADYESLVSSAFVMTLIVTAVDKPDQGDAKTGTAIVWVTIAPENEFSPAWTSPVPDGTNFMPGVTVSEAAPPGSLVMAVGAEDNDEGDDGKIVYSIVEVVGGDSGNTITGKFSIASSSGQLLVAGELDADSGTGGESSYTVTLRASDQGASPRSVDAKVVVTLTNQNDNPPFFDQAIYSANVSEAKDVGYVVATLTIDDYDADSVTLSVVNGGDGLFECTGNDVVLKAKLDYETSTYHVMLIRANDGVFETDVPLRVNVLDASDEVPVITLKKNLVVSEEQAVGTGVCGLYDVTDADAAAVITYFITGADSGYFNINSSTGKLSVAEHIDREGSGGVSSVSLTLRAEDEGGLYAETSMSLTVLDVNDPPSFGYPAEYNVEVVENKAADLSLVDLTPSDQDTGNNTVYSITLASGSGNFKVVDSKLYTDATPLNYEDLESSGYEVTVVVHAIDTPDEGEPKTGTAVVHVTVKPENEYTPKWTAPDATGAFGTVSIKENVNPGTDLSIQVQASDDDNGADGDIVFSIQSLTDADGATVSGKIAVDASTGQLRVSGDLDADTGTGGTSSYSVVVRASDKGSTPLFVDGTVTIDLENVNDNAPTFNRTDYSGSVPESAAVNDVVLTMTTTDLDGDTVTLSAVSGRTDLFACSGHGVVIKAALDYENERAHVLIVRATDGDHNVDVAVNIDVEDIVDEKPVITLSGTKYVSEEQTVGTGVDPGFIVTDADKGDAITYSISGVGSSYFNISATTGEMTLIQHIDREANVDNVTFTLTVTDSAGLTADQSITMLVQDLNDLSPVFNPNMYSIEVVENTVADQSLLSFTVSDSDTGTNADFDVFVQSGDDTAAKFKTSGLNLLTGSNILDYESASSYTLVIKGVGTADADGVSNTGRAVVEVTVLPENEFAPVWKSPPSDGSGGFDPVTIDEDLDVGGMVVNFTATDDDSGADGHVTYSIVSVNGGTADMDKFSINEHTGIILLAKELDADTGTGGVSKYDVVVRAVDGGSPAKTTDGTLTINLNNVNDNAPTFDQMIYTSNTAEDISVGDVVLSPVTEDHDNDAVTVSISSISDMFESDGTKILLKKLLDYETQKYHVVTIKASDGKHESEAALHVYVQDVIDEHPVITVIGTGSVAEEQSVGTGVWGNYMVTEADANDELAFSISGTDSSFFSINSTTGVMTMAATVDREAPKTDLTLTLTVVDKAGLQAVKDISFVVADINDNNPVFSQPVYKVQMDENTLADTSLIELVCTDKDEGNNAKFNLVLQSGNMAKFKIANSEIWTAASDVDYESLESVNFKETLVVVAVDTPDQGEPRTGTTCVEITVLPVNEHTPAWTAPASDGSGTFDDITLSEDADLGHKVVTFVATDDDKGTDGKVTYSLETVESGTAYSGLFTINPNSGDLIISAPLDFDVGTGGSSMFVITVKATDGGTPAKSFRGTLSINLDNVNDNDPMFSESLYEISVAENAAIDDVATTLDVEDYDGDAVTLTVQSGGDNLFTCVGKDVLVIGALDYEKKQFYVLIIRASDGTRTTDVPVHISVVDVIDEPPVISMEFTSSLSEEQKIGTPVVGGFIVTDADVTDEHTFALSGADSNLLSITAESGYLKVNKHIDRDLGQTNLTLTLTVTDKAGLTATQAFTLNVEDINDLAPRFGSAIYDIEVDENTAVDTDVHTFVAVDGDAGNNAQFTMAVSQGDDTTPKFKMSSINLQTEANPTDFETTSQYILIVLATDTPDSGSPQTGTAVIKIRVAAVNEYGPVWKGPSSDGAGTFDPVNLAEDTALGTVVATFTATDDDAGDDGAVNYAVVSVVGDSGSDGMALFSLGSQSGELIIAEQLDADAGGDKSYVITVKATDSGSTPRSVEGTITVNVDNVNDNAPVFSANEYIFDVDEDTTAVSAPFASLTTSDLDGDTVTLSLTEGDLNIFDLSGHDLVLKVGINYEQRRTYQLCVSASDGTYESTVSVKINVVNLLDETPSITVFGAGKMTDGQAMGSVVVAWFVTDDDKDDELDHQLTGTDSHYFNINAATGQLTVKEVVERDGGSGVTQLTGLTLTVTDKNGNQATKTLTIEVVDANDNAPVFGASEYSIEVEENSATDLSLLDLTCTDIDEGNNADFTVSAGGPDSVKSMFKLDNLQLQTSSEPLDYDSLAASNYMYTVTVIAVDQPDDGKPLTGSTLIKVKVKPINEHTPVWLKPKSTGSFDAINVGEDVSPGTVLATFEATDGDSGDDGAVVYNIDSVTGAVHGANTGMFSIDPKSGELIVVGDLDADTGTNGESSYDIVLKASDSGTSPKTVEGTVTVQIQNINDNPPVFDQKEYAADLTENSNVGTVVISLPVTDHDNDAVTLTVDSANAGLFECEAAEVKVKGTIDYETEKVHVLAISASDGKHTVPVTLTVNIINAVDVAPVISVLTPSPTMSEGQAIGTGVNGAFVVTNADKEATLTYSLGGADKDYITIDANTGGLQVAADIDREASHDVLSLTLTVTDQGGNTASEDFQIVVEDVNDNPPVCSPKVFTTDVLENTPTADNGDTVLLTLTCHDDDSGNNAVFSIIIGSGDNATHPKFKIDGKDLKTNTADIDYEALSDGGYVLVLEAVDTPDDGPALTGTAIVQVNVLPKNEFPPVWTGSVPDGNGYLTDVSVDEDAAPGTSIVTLSAEDADLSADGDVSYEITSVRGDDGSDASGTFVIGSKSGELQVKSGLDADAGISYYEIGLRAVDGGNPSQEAAASIKVYVNNVNDLPPHFVTDGFTGLVPEDAAVGSTIFAITAADRDGDAVTLKVEGTGSAVFECKGNEIVLLQPLDFETRRYHTFQMSASDGIHKVFHTFVANVENVMDEDLHITINPYQIPEGLLKGFVLGDIFSIQDKDIGETYQYSLTGSDKPYFNIDSSLGTISIADDVDTDSGRTVLDDITLNIMDATGKTKSANLKFDLMSINDNPPVFAKTSYTAAIAENGANGQSLLELTVSDVDNDASEIELRVAEGDNKANPIFSVSGRTLLADAANADFETNETFKLVIQAVDKPTSGQPLTGSTLVEVTVTAENESPPEWDEPAVDANNEFGNLTVSELAHFAYLVSNFTATDLDNGVDGILTYNIRSTRASTGNATDVFTMLTKDNVGMLLVSRQLDADAATGGVEYYVLELEVKDGGTPAFSATGSVTIYIKDENEEIPADPPQDLTEVWVLRGLMIATGTGAALCAAMGLKSLLTKALTKTPMVKVPKLNGNLERPTSLEKNWTVQDLERMYEESVIPSETKIRPPP